MIGRNHLLFGTGVAIIATGGIDPLFLAGAAIGALLPDIDHHNSLITHRVPLIGPILGRLLHHRGVTHSLVALGAIGALSAFWPLQGASYGLVLGYASHLLGDWATDGGIPLWWPAARRVKAPWTWRSGHPLESLLSWAFLGAAFLF